MNLVNEYSRVQRVAEAGSLQQLAVMNQKMPADGFYYTYVTNQSQKSMQFDNFTYIHIEGQLREVTDYYPYGMLCSSATISDYSKTKFQSKELNSKEFAGSWGLDWYNHGARMYDPELGRWHVQDPALQFSNPYLAMANNPVSFSDADGMRAGTGFQTPQSDNTSWGAGYASDYIDATLNRTLGHNPNYLKSDFQPMGEPSSWGTGGNNDNYGVDASGHSFAVAQKVSDKLREQVRSGSIVPVNRVREIGWMKDGVAYIFNMPQVDVYPDGTTSYDIHDAIQNSLDGLGGNGNNGLFWTNAALTTEDMYNNFFHNHNTYTTTKGIEKEIYLSNGAVRSARAVQFANVSKVVKGLGLAGGALGTGMAASNLLNGELTTRNYADATIGTIGLMDAGAGYLVSGYSVPVVGQAVAIYSWEVLWYDLGASYGPSKWYGNDNSSWFK